MNREIRKSEFRLPMIEIVIVIGVFAVLSVFLLRMFVTADRLSSDAENIGTAVVHAQSAAERIKGGENPETVLSDLGLSRDGATDRGAEAVYSGFYDRDWKPVREAGAFEMRIQMSVSETNVLTALITVTDSGKKELCSLSVKKYGGNGEFDMLRSAEE